MTDPYCYLASEYFGTGEGITICLYIARCHDIDDEIQSFKQRFGFYTEYFEMFERKYFLEQYKRLIPTQVAKMLATSDIPGGFVWSCEYHLNYS